MIDIDDDVVVQNVDPLPEPLVPTRAQISTHNITHLPYRSWCKHCVAARRPNSPHLRSKTASQRSKPLLVADYCYVRDNADQELATILVARLYPAKALLATVCPHKGVDEKVFSVQCLVDDIAWLGYTRIELRSDNEPAIVALLRESLKALRVEGVVEQASEEHPPP